MESLILTTVWAYSSTVSRGPGVVGAVGGVSRGAF
jgi:hypothetical protein